MKGRFALLCLCLLISLTPIAFLLLYPVPAHSGAGSAVVSGVHANEEDEKIDGALLAAMKDARSGKSFRFIVHLTESTDLTKATLPANQPARGAIVVQRLQQTATSSQGLLIRQLERLQTLGVIKTFHSFWIINGIAVTGTAEAIRQIATRPEVKSISLDARHRYFEPSPRWPGLEQVSQTTITTTGDLSWGVERIGTAYVWDALGVSGDGITVAFMDSGVDWLHPALFTNYRGNLGGGNINHSGNWFDTTDPSATEPIDHLGHGTHVAGTAVGQNGIGVAPGAKWIAVRVADEYGFIYESDIHSGFEWLLAPNGDPALAPDIVNNSWGGPPDRKAFLEDVKALQAAGIIAVFAAGNNGPFAGTINSPASYTSTLAVGASDDLDAPAWFSSRGPSPFTDKVKPLLLAPGTYILSALPNSQYGYLNGTSMATPHVAGAIALLLSANPALTHQEIEQLLINSTVPISATHPNASSGWGRLDAYAAVSQQVQNGILQGTISSNGLPLPGVSVTITTESGAQLHYQSDENGLYQAVLRSGSYTLTISHFGFMATSLADIAVVVDQTTIRDVNLTPLSTGTITGIVVETNTGVPLEATIHVIGTPVTTTTDEDGRYTLNLPENQYKLLVQAAGHHLGRAIILPLNDQTRQQNFFLEPSPSVLLLDSGQWYYNTYANYYQDSLTALNYTYDQWTIRDPYHDIPTTDDLLGYDFLIWSAPLDSPGYLGLSQVITDYLGTGGNLLISGQNVGSFDGYNYELWWYRDLEAVYAGEIESSQQLTGTVGTAFEGVTLTLNEGTSANNQTVPDKVTPRVGSLSSPIFSYNNDEIGALQAGQCDPFRIVYFGFGLEGVSDASDRAALLDRSFDYFLSPRMDVGVRWGETPVNDFAVPGSQMVYTFTVRNLSETVTDTFQLDTANATWATSLMTKTLTLGPCAIGKTVLTIDVPSDAPIDTHHVMEITALSSNDNNVTAQLELHHKTPGHILFVDDDRWYDQEAEFQSALDAMDLTYDVWTVGWDEDIRGSPPSHLLNAFDMVIWYTGYDWYAPVTAKENQALFDYLVQGGRLFLNSQDFLYYHHDTSLAREYLGVLDYRESITPTQIYRGDNLALSPDLAGPLPLTYEPYRNFSDGVIPVPGSHSFLWHDQGMAAGIATAGANWRSIFLGTPFETLPDSAQAVAMNDIVGWLSDLGDTTFTVDQRSGRVEEPRTYVVTLRNIDSGFSNQLSMTNTLPSDMVIKAETITGNATYDPALHQLTWQGVLASGATHYITYQAFPASGLVSGTRLDNRLIIHDGRYNLSFARIASMWVSAPDLTASRLTATINRLAAAEEITYTLHLNNVGLEGTDVVSAVVRLPDELIAITDTLSASAGNSQLANQRVFWQGDVAVGDIVTVSLALTRETTTHSVWLPATAVIQDGVTDILVRDIQLYLPPVMGYFPFIAKN